LVVSWPLTGIGYPALTTKLQFEPAHFRAFERSLWRGERKLMVVGTGGLLRSPI
jgi:hypothetical protein